MGQTADETDSVNVDNFVQHYLCMEKSEEVAHS